MFLDRTPQPPPLPRFPRIRGDVPKIDGAKFEGTVVFPAYAGMFLCGSQASYAPRCFPRIRGDVPKPMYVLVSSKEFSPHTRGCSPSATCRELRKPVFPAYAGMFLFVRLRGRGCSGFPRIRGDVPQRRQRHHKISKFSPHTRGYSRRTFRPPPSRIVFPAYAGMFRDDFDAELGAVRFPRIRGDVPNLISQY